MEETCGVCGGDGRIGNSFGGSTTTCPACRGTGKRGENVLFRDVTKTKPAHFRKPTQSAAEERSKGPTTYEGAQLAKEIEACPKLSKETKAKLTREIIDYEDAHGKCTKTFVTKIRKQLRSTT